MKNNKQSLPKWFRELPKNWGIKTYNEGAEVTNRGTLCPTKTVSLTSLELTMYVYIKRMEGSPNVPLDFPFRSEARSWLRNENLQAHWTLID